MSRIHLIVGPVGAGKTTFARTLAAERRALRIDLDDWMATLFRPDRPEEGLVEWYVNRVDRCLAQIWRMAVEAVGNRIEVVLEVGLIRRAERAAFYDRVEAAHIPLSVYLLDAPRDLRRQRVHQRNIEQGPTFSMVVPPAIFEFASDRWEPPDEAERLSRAMRVVAADNDAPELSPSA